MGLAAISYDSPAVLAQFAERTHIEFPLLSDAGSEIIRRFGILNETIQRGNPAYGVPYPGVYVLDSRGVVRAKFFEGDYRERDTAGMILLKQFGIPPDDTHASVTAKHLQVSAAATDSRAQAGQHVSLLLDLEIPPGVHVYAPGVKGYIPINWEIAGNDAVKAGPVEYPESKMMTLDAIHETVPVYVGHVRLIRDVAIGTQKDLASLLDAQGNLSIAGSLRYQACDQTQCFIPEIVPLTWTLKIEQLDRVRAVTK